VTLHNKIKGSNFFPVVMVMVMSLGEKRWFCRVQLKDLRTMVTNSQISAGIILTKPSVEIGYTG
jgi:hypothetical protein